MNQKPKRHRYPASIISFAVWSYHRFNDSYRDVSQEYPATLATFYCQINFSL